MSRNREQFGKLTGDQIQSLRLTSDNLSDNSVTRRKIARQAVGNLELANSAVNRDKLADDVRNLLVPRETYVAALHNERGARPSGNNPYVTWDDFLGARSSWQSPVRTRDQLPAIDNLAYDVRLVSDERALYSWFPEPVRRWVKLYDFNGSILETVASDSVGNMAELVLEHGRDKNMSRIVQTDIYRKDGIVEITRKTSVVTDSEGELVEGWDPSSAYTSQRAEAKRTSLLVKPGESEARFWRSIGARYDSNLSTHVAYFGGQAYSIAGLDILQSGERGVKLDGKPIIDYEGQVRVSAIDVVNNQIRLFDNSSAETPVRMTEDSVEKMRIVCDRKGRAHVFYIAENGLLYYRHNMADERRSDRQSFSQPIPVRQERVYDFDVSFRRDRKLNKFDTPRSKFPAGTAYDTAYAESLEQQGWVQLCVVIDVPGVVSTDPPKQIEFFEGRPQGAILPIGPWTNWAAAVAAGEWDLVGESEGRPESISMASTPFGPPERVDSDINRTPAVIAITEESLSAGSTASESSDGLVRCFVKSSWSANSWVEALESDDQPVFRDPGTGVLSRGSGVRVTFDAGGDIEKGIRLLYRRFDGSLIMWRGGYGVQSGQQVNFEKRWILIGSVFNFSVPRGQTYSMATMPWKVRMWTSHALPDSVKEGCSICLDPDGKGRTFARIKGVFRNTGNIFTLPDSAPNIDKNPLFNSGKFPLDSNNARSIKQLGAIGAGIPQAWLTRPHLVAAGGGTVDNRYHPATGDIISDIMYDPESPAPSAYLQYLHGINTTVFPQYDWASASEAPGSAGHLGNPRPQLDTAAPLPFAPNYIEIDGGEDNLRNFSIWHRIIKPLRGETVVVNGTNYIPYNDESIIVDRGLAMKVRVCYGDPIKATVVDFDHDLTKNRKDANPMFCLLPELKNYQQYVSEAGEIGTQNALLPLREGKPISWGSFDWDHLISDAQVDVVEGETVIYAIDDSDFQRIKKRTYGTQLIENRKWLGFNGLHFPSGSNEVNSWAEVSDVQLGYGPSSSTPNPAEAAAYRSMIYSRSYNQTTNGFGWIDSTAEGVFMGYRALWMNAVVNEETGGVHLIFGDAEEGGKPKYVHTEDGGGSFGRAIHVINQGSGSVPGDISLDYRQRPGLVCYSQSGNTRGMNYVDMPWPIRSPWLRQTGNIFGQEQIEPRYGALWIPLSPNQSEKYFQESYQHSNARWEEEVILSRDQREEKSRYAYESSGLIHGGITADGRLSNKLYFFNVFTGAVDITPGNSPYRAFHCGAVDNRGYLWLYGGGGDRNGSEVVAPDLRNVPQLPQDEQKQLYYCRLVPWSSDRSQTPTGFYNTAFTTNDIVTGRRPFTGFRSMRIADDGSAPTDVICGRMFFLSTRTGQAPGDEITPYSTFASFYSGEKSGNYTGWTLNSGGTAKVLPKNHLAIAAATATAPPLSSSDVVARDRAFINTANFQASGPWAGQLKNTLCSWDGVEWTFSFPQDGDVIFYRRATDLAAAGYTVLSYIRSVALDTEWPGSITPIPSGYAGVGITDNTDDGFYQYSMADNKWLRLSYYNSSTQEWTRINAGEELGLVNAPPPEGNPLFEDYAMWSRTGGRDKLLTQHLYIYKPDDAGSKMYRVEFDASSLRVHPEFPGNIDEIDNRNGRAWDVFNNDGVWVQRRATGWLPDPAAALVNDLTMNSVFTAGKWETVDAEGSAPPDGLIAPATDYDPYDERMYSFGGVVITGESRQYNNGIYELSVSPRRTTAVGSIVTVNKPEIFQWNQADFSGEVPTGRCGATLAKTMSGLYVFGGKVGEESSYDAGLSDETWQFSFANSASGAVSGGTWNNWSGDGQRPPKSCYITGGSLPYGGDGATASDGLFVCLGKTFQGNSFADSFRFGPSEGMINAWGRKGHFVDRENHGEVSVQSEGSRWDGVSYRASDFSRFGVFPQGPSTDDHDKKCFYTIRVVGISNIGGLPPTLPWGSSSPYNNPLFGTGDPDVNFLMSGSENPNIPIGEPFWEAPGQTLSSLLKIEHPILRATEDDRPNEIVIHEMTPIDSILSRAWEPLEQDAFGNGGYGWGSAGPARNPANFAPLPRHRTGNLAVQVVRYWEGRDPESGRVMAQKAFSDCTIGRRQPRKFTDAIGGAYTNWSRSWVYQNDLGSFVAGDWGGLGDPFNRYDPDDAILSGYPVFMLRDESGEPLYGQPAASTQINAIVSFDGGISWKYYSTSAGGWLSVDPRDAYLAGHPMPGLIEDAAGFGTGDADSAGIEQIGLPRGDAESIDRLTYAQWNLSTGPTNNRGFQGGTTTSLRFMFSLDAFHWPRWTPYIKSVRIRHTGGGYWEPVYDPNNGVQIKKLSPTKTAAMNVSGESQRMRLSVIIKPN